ncbi:MAG: D-alanyl-D-alanine carboxypeptidase/D-alanyl-D-alanine-endopeptidase [Pseudomonadota bacterium]
MKKIIIFGLLLLNIITLPVFALSLDKSVSTLISKYIPNATVGISVADDQSGKIIYGKNSSQRFVPASNMKLFTAASALFTLKSSYRFDTTVAAEAKTIKDGVLHGNLYITFTGDPSLTSTDLRLLLKQLKSKGIDEIQGDVVLDGSRFAGRDYAEGWTQDSINWSYSAPITAISLNQNKFAITLKATSKIGSVIPARVAGYGNYFPVSSTVVAATQQQAADQCSFISNMGMTNRVTLGGCWPALKDDSVLSMAIRNPALFVRQLVANILSSNGIKLTGKTIIGKAPTNLTTLVRHRSAPLAELVKTMLKHSNNFYAGCFIKSVGADYYGTGTFANGVLAEKKLLTDKAGVDFKQMTIFDGSGQSYYDYLQPRQIVRLLYRVDHSPIKSDFYRALPIAGQDGTLAYRMGNIRGRVHAKTGTLGAGHSSLSGYVINVQGKKLVFSILVNNALSINRARQFQNALVTLLYHYPFSK